MIRVKTSRLAIIASLLAVGALATACGASTKTTPAAYAPPASHSTASAASSTGSASVTAVDTSLGKILAGPSGRTLYGFTNDTNATSTCYSTCAKAWPPLTVGAQWTVAPGLDTGIFSTAARTDGTSQLVVGKWPLYYYAGDTAPGDTSGQGSGGVWYVVGVDGKLITSGQPSARTSGAPYPGSSTASSAGSGAGSAPVTTAKTSLGQSLVDGKGRTLYGFTKDTAGTSTCAGACTTTWPPLLITGSTLPAGLDPKVFSVVDNPSGQKQLKAGKWPLYRFSGDQNPGDTNGEGSGGSWFALSPTGALIKP